MENPIIAQKAPHVLDLEPGTYYWCSCVKAVNSLFVMAHIKNYKALYV